MFSAFNPSKCTHLEQWAADCAAPGEQSWTSCRSWDSNPQPWVTSGFKSNALSIRPMTAQGVGEAFQMLAVNIIYCNFRVNVYKNIPNGSSAAFHNVQRQSVIHHFNTFLSTVLSVFQRINSMTNLPIKTGTTDWM